MSVGWVRTALGASLTLLGILSAFSAALEYTVFHSITRTEALYVWGLSLFLMVCAAFLVLEGDRK